MSETIFLPIIWDHDQYVSNRITKKVPTHLREPAVHEDADDVSDLERCFHSALPGGRDLVAIFEWYSELALEGRLGEERACEADLGQLAYCAFR